MVFIAALHDSLSWRCCCGYAQASANCNPKMLWNRPQSSTGTSPQTGQNGSETGCGEWIEMNELQFRHRHSVACNDGLIVLLVPNVVFSSIPILALHNQVDYQRFYEFKNCYFLQPNKGLQGIERRGKLVTQVCDKDRRSAG
jgi:hypothetical protein